MAIEPSQEAFRHQVHPVVTRHPETGREALYVNSVYTTRIDGWSNTESAGLLGHLHRHAVNENFTCRLKWRPHMLAIWDNRCTQHNALNDYRGVRREMFRTSVVGAAPIAAREIGGCLTRRGPTGAPRRPRRPVDEPALPRLPARPPTRAARLPMRPSRSLGRTAPEAEREALVHRRTDPWWRRILRLFVLSAILAGVADRRVLRGRRPRRTTSIATGCRRQASTAPTVLSATLPRAVRPAGRRARRRHHRRSRQ